MDLASAEKSIRHGAAGGFFLAALTLILVWYGLVFKPSGYFRTWNDPSALLDALLLLGLSYGILRRSRGAAVCLLGYFILTKIMLVIELHTVSGASVSFAFLYLFGRSLKGTFAYHRIQKEEDPNYKAAPKWTYFVGPPVLLMALTFFSYVLLSTIGILPSANVIEGSKLKASDLEFLRSSDVLNPNESVVLFYSVGILSIAEGGTIISDTRVVSYQTLEGEVSSASAPFNDISDVYVARKGNSFTETVIHVTTFDGRTIPIAASVYGGGDALVVSQIREKSETSSR